MYVVTVEFMTRSGWALQPPRRESKDFALPDETVGSRAEAMKLVMEGATKYLAGSVCGISSRWVQDYAPWLVDAEQDAKATPDDDEEPV